MKASTVRGRNVNGSLSRFDQQNAIDQNDEQQSTPTSSRRARYACENCRRKKSRCPGERPKCSLCLRLGQRCIYADGRRRYRHTSDDSEPQASIGASNRGSHRLDAIEKKLEELADALRNNNKKTASDSDTPINIHESINSSSHLLLHNTNRDQQDDQIESLSLHENTVEQRLDLEYSLGDCIPTDIITEAIRCYFKHYDNQPYPLLSQLGERNLPQIADLEPLLIYSMLALVLRSCQTPSLSTANLPSLQAFCVESAWKILSKAYINYEFDDVYFQGLCLLAQADFDAGRFERAISQVALGLKLTQLRGWFGAEYYVHITGQKMDQMAIVWTLFIMDRTLNVGRTSSPSCRYSSFKLPVFQGGPLWSEDAQSINNATPFALTDSLDCRDFTPSSSIVALIIENAKVWEDVVGDTFHTDLSKSTQIWQKESSFTAITSVLLEFELKIGSHSYFSIGSATQILHVPHRRKYFGAWLYFQLSHSAAHCLVNHPFMIFMKTRHYQGRVPLSFLQKSLKDCKIHANWIFRHISEMEEADLDLHDAFTGYVTGIAASVHLEQTLSRIDSVAKVSKLRFEKCQRYVQRMAEKWPNLSNTVDVLNKLVSRVRHRQAVVCVDSEYDGVVQSDNMRQVTVEEQDIDLMWSLFDYTATTRRPEQGVVNPNVQDQHASQHIDMHVHAGGNETMARELDHDLRQMQYNSHFTDVLSQNGLDIDSVQVDPDDWLLFGRPWSAYFPLDVSN